MNEHLTHGIELEKKFLIAYPDLGALAKYQPIKYEIEQIYLLSEVGSHRIRKRATAGECRWFETLKIRITGTKCHEYECKITEENYEKLRQQADPAKHPIIKDRYMFDYQGKTLELDVYPFWKDKAVLEIELNDENETYAIPPEITLLQDVSEDGRYKNNYLASVNHYEDY